VTMSSLSVELPLPRPRGPLSSGILDALMDRPVDFQNLLAVAKMVAGTGVVRDEDAQLALLVLYELHYRGITGVSDCWEWHPELLAVRAVLEDRFETEIRDLTVVPAVPADGDIAGLLFGMTAPRPGPSVSKFIAHRATVEQFREFLTHRSVYHLKEADPFTWLIPRLSGTPKAALVQIQADEYGGGDAKWMHSALFADTMSALGLDAAAGPPLDRLPGTTLAVTNLLSFFGLHRRLRGQCAGALALFEMTSCIPNRRYGDGLRRLGFGPEETRFFDEHVEADAVHEAVAATDLAGALATQEGLGREIVFGARALQATEGLAAAQQLDAWTAGRSSLLPGRAARHLAAIP